MDMALIFNFFLACIHFGTHFKAAMSYQAACDMGFTRQERPSSDTKPVLHAWRLKVNAKA